MYINCWYLWPTEVVCDGKALEPHRRLWTYGIHSYSFTHFTQISRIIMTYKIANGYKDVSNLILRWYIILILRLLFVVKYSSGDCVALSTLCLRWRHDTLERIRWNCRLFTRVKRTYNYKVVSRERKRMSHNWVRDSFFWFMNKIKLLPAISYSELQLTLMSWFMLDMKYSPQYWWLILTILITIYHLNIALNMIHV